jgi:polar amino acid transport system substrate-binding protein
MTGSAPRDHDLPSDHDAPGAGLTAADLTGADLTGAALTDTRPTGAAELTGAELSGTGSSGHAPSGRSMRAGLPVGGLRVPPSSAACSHSQRPPARRVLARRPAMWRACVAAALAGGLCTAAIAGPVAASGQSGAEPSPAVAASAPAAVGSRSAVASPVVLRADCSGAALQKDLYKKGRLTVATDSPAYTPWFSNNDPSNGKGYESAVAYAVGQQLGFSHAQVRWVVEPFDSSYAPGPKAFDFDINEISYTPARAQAVSFSASYYAVTQALVAIKGDGIVARHSPAQLRHYLYGDQIGTTSLAFIDSRIRPTAQPQVFDTLNDVKSALVDHRIDAFVTDTPTAQYIATSEIPNGVLVAQFPSTGEHYGLLFRKGDPLVGCVDEALATLRADGTLARLVKQYLSVYTQVPTIKP